MKSVELEFRVSYGRHNFTREMIIWTEKTGPQYYPLSYSLRDCLELICEKLGWEYVQHEIFDTINGCLHAMKPEPKDVGTLEWWTETDYIEASATGWSSDTIFYTTGT